MFSAAETKVIFFVITCSKNNSTSSQSYLQIITKHEVILDKESNYQINLK